MRIRLLRLGLDIDLSTEQVRTLQVEDRSLFSRIIHSLISGEGEYAEEPYLLFDEEDNQLASKKNLLILNSIPEIPLTDRQLITQLYKKVEAQSELDPARYEHIQALMGELIKEIEGVSETLWGTYSFSSQWDMSTYLKAFAFSPVSDEDLSLLDSILRLMELCSDVGDERVHIYVNLKSFFTKKELEEIFEKAIFSKIRMLLIESWVDDEKYLHENKTIIDQQFCVL